MILINYSVDLSAFVIFIQYTISTSCVPQCAAADQAPFIFRVIKLTFWDATPRCQRNLYITSEEFIGKARFERPGYEQGAAGRESINSKVRT